MPLRRRRRRRCRSTLRREADERAALPLPQLRLRTSQRLAQRRRVCRNRIVLGGQARGGRRQLELSLGEPSDDLGMELEAGSGRCGRHLCGRRRRRDEDQGGGGGGGSSRSSGWREWRRSHRGWRQELAVLDSKCVFGRTPLALLGLLDSGRGVGQHASSEPGGDGTSPTGAANCARVRSRFYHPSHRPLPIGEACS